MNNLFRVLHFLYFPKLLFSSSFSRLQPLAYIPQVSCSIFLFLYCHIDLVTAPACHQEIFHLLPSRCRLEGPRHWPTSQSLQTSREDTSPSAPPAPSTGPGQLHASPKRHHLTFGENCPHPHSAFPVLHTIQNPLEISSRHFVCLSSKRVISSAHSERAISCEMPRKKLWAHPAQL